MSDIGVAFHNLRNEMKRTSNVREKRKTCKSKTFQKGDEAWPLIDWVTRQIETNEYQPEGTDWGGGMPSPHDPVCELKHKYVITITRFEE